MINREITIRDKGYDPNFLKPQSGKKICAICDNCGKERWIPYQSYRDLCHSCAQKLRKRSPEELKRISDSVKNHWKLPTPKFVPESERFLTGIDRILTIEKFGYDPIDLKPKSRKIVITICQQCGKLREIKMAAYRDLCGSCAITNRFKDINERKRLSDNNKKYWNNSESRIKQSILKQGITIEDFKGFIGRHPERDYLTVEENCIKLNQRFMGLVFHHISKSVGIYIPKYIHKSIRHNMKNGHNINEINKLAMNYLMGDY